MKIKTITILLQIIFFLLFGEYSIAQNSKSIYEYGDSIEGYDTNFKNLFNNWKEDNITNANDYKLLSYSFVERIDNQRVFDYYRNYFSGNRFLGSSTRGSSGENKFGRYREFFVQPRYLFQQFEDTTGMPVEIKQILTKEFQEQLKSLISKEIDVDSLNIYKYKYFKSDTDTTITKSSKSIKSTTTVAHIVSDKKLSKKSEDVMLGKKRFNEIPIANRQELMLEEVKSQRLFFQTHFNDNVSLGDVIYVVNFRYFDKFYTNYVVCSKTTKRVIIDGFFKNIKVYD